jgi:ADP-ribosylglycohydrolase
MKNITLDLLLGVAIGDALGVPYEFSSREKMAQYPAKDMVGYQVYNQPSGTWSDDSSLTFCLAESLTTGYSLKSTAQNFIQWKDKAYWTAHNEVFDIGITTSKSISRLKKIIEEQEEQNEEALKDLKYGAEESDNGNGSLMRILPLLMLIKGDDIQEQFNIIWENSALTHRHIRAAMSCLIYLKLSEHLINGEDKLKAYQATRVDIQAFWEAMDFSENERTHFQRTIQQDIQEVPQQEILSGGYVIESLEASLWCFLKTNSYKEAVLTAINFGHDTDTTAAITGGLAGIYYNAQNIPKHWIDGLARIEDIKKLADRLNEVYTL